MLGVVALESTYYGRDNVHGINHFLYLPRPKILEGRLEKRKHEASFYCFLMSCVRLHEAYVTFCTVEAFG